MTAFNKAWDFLKALPEQQMFIEPMPRDLATTRPEYNTAGVDHPFMNSASDVGPQSYPEIDRFGARSAGTIHPAILSLLQRHSEQMGFTPDLNLATGAKESSALNDRYLDSLIGTLIAQSPRYNRIFYDDQHIDSKYPEAGEAESLAGWDRYGD